MHTFLRTLLVFIILAAAIDLMYNNGTGLPKDYVDAVKLYRKTAEQGFYAAQTFLVGIYDNGVGVPKDLVQAPIWRDIAAAKESEIAEENLAIVEKDILPNRADNTKLITETINKNFYKYIPVEVNGIPYSYTEICGNHTIDYIIDAKYKMISTGQSSKFVNFKINKFVFDFNKDGSLILSSVTSYDRTPAGSDAFYPENLNDIHKWNLKPKFHQHLTSDCSLDRYDDIAISQAKLNEMIKDSSLRKVYDVLLSCAEDMDYDYNRVGKSVGFVTPTPLLGVCDDYANLLVERIRKTPIAGVSDIVKVTGQNHAWVTLKYKGKTLYLDAGWFDTNEIDETGTVVHIPYKDPTNMTFDRDIFTNHGSHHIAN